jgi:hypothetical protein
MTERTFGLCVESQAVALYRCIWRRDEGAVGCDGAKIEKDGGLAWWGRISTPLQG